MTHDRWWRPTVLCVVLLAALVAGPTAQSALIRLPLQTRDQQNQPHVTEVQIESARIGVVVMDMWDKHWDPLATRRVAALVPRMNQFLHNARAAGATVIWSPSNTIHATYASTQQRQAILSIPPSLMPQASDFQPAKPIPWTTSPRNMDGTSPYHSPPVGAWSNQCHGLDIETADLMTADDTDIDARQELWNLTQAKKITHLLYVGVHTNWCVSNRPNGLIPMKRLGLSTALVRDLTDAWSDPYDGYDRDQPRPDITPNKATQLVIEHQERYIQPTVTSAVFPETTPVLPVALRRAVAGYSQSGYPVAAAIDGSTSLGNGWGNGGNSRKENWAAFETAEKIGGQEGSMLTFVLDFTSNPNHGFGKFRLSATNLARPLQLGRSEGTGADAQWTVIKPRSVRSLSVGTQFRVLDDGAVLVTATQRPKCDRYVVTAETRLAGITAVRLEALCDDTFPQRGPGLRETNGNFVLGEFSLRISSANGAASSPGPPIVPGVVLPESLGAPQAATWQGDAQSLRLAIVDLTETFGPRYVKGQEYLARLDALEASPAGSDLASSLEALASEALLDNPLLDFERLLVIKRRPLVQGRPGDPDTAVGGDIGLPRSSMGNCTLPHDAFDNEIAVLQPVAPGGALTTLYRPPRHEPVVDVDLNFAADKLLFATRDEVGRFQIFEMGSDGSGLRQVTRDRPSDVDYYRPVYLPDERILCCSTANFQCVPCNGSSVALLYRMNDCGEDIRQLTFDQDHSFDPTVMPDGRIMYLRWEYSDLPHSNSRILFTMNPDGTGQAPYYGANSYWPNSLFGARPIPDHPGMFLGIVAGHHDSYREGELTLFDVRRGRHEGAGAVQRIPGRGQEVRPLVADRLTTFSWPKFVHPFPLSDKYFLVSAKLEPDAPWALYLADVFDNLMLLHHAAGFGLFEPIPLRKRQRPPVIPDNIAPDRSDAVVHLRDIYHGTGLAGVPRGTVKQLRLYTLHFGYRGRGGLLGTVGLDGPWDVRRVLGTVPVAPDGSAHFRIPANTPVSLQPLDAEGQALQQMRSWLVGMPGENISCLGCHEPQDSVPAALAMRDLETPLAATSPPSEITPWYGPPRNFSFQREVQPVIDRHCVGCHDGSPEGKSIDLPDLRGNLRTVDYRTAIDGSSGGVGGKDFSEAYFQLSRFVRRPGIESDLRVLVPAEFHADTTDLVRLLRQGHHGVQLNDEDWDRLITWIDMNAPFHGTWTEAGIDPGPQRQQRRALRLLYAGVDEDPEALADQELPPAARAPATRDQTPSAKEVPNPQPPEVAGWPFTASEAGSRQAAAAEQLVPNGQPRITIDLGPGPVFAAAYLGPDDVRAPVDLSKHDMSLELVLVPGGSFVMGSTGGVPDECPPTVVPVEPFWMGKFEITNAQYRVFDPGHESRDESRLGYQFGRRGFFQDGPQQPVVRVSWHQTMAFCTWLSERTGWEFTLPTEAQWEYACRAGSADAFHFGSLDNDYSQYANLADRSLRQFAQSTGADNYTRADPIRDPNRYDAWIPRCDRYNDGGLVTMDVGSYLANPWGLCDLHGNTAEWTRSEYRAYPYDPADGRNDARPGGWKVVRGGSWRDRPQYSRSATRWRYPAWQSVFNVGFRVVASVSGVGSLTGAEARKSAVPMSAELRLRTSRN